MTIDPAKASPTKPLLQTLRGEAAWPPPIWLMRQAGRYLPEYREVRAQAGGFLDLCYRPDFAVEVTLQPIRRFGMDGAILFSDILVVPHALGQEVWFEAGVGPKLTPLRSREDLALLRPEGLREALEPVYETLRRLKRELPPQTTLLGFAGAPWTLASYMIEGGSSKDYATARTWAYRDREGFRALIDLLVTAVSDHLSAQIEAGAEAVQVFDSWAGALAPEEMRAWSLEPLSRIVAAVKAKHSETPIILFPRGAGPIYPKYAEIKGAAALSLDTSLPPAWAAGHLQGKLGVQGNLDPMALVAGGAALESGIDRLLEAFRGRPYVFNLGHGVVPQTPPEHVAALVERVRRG